MNRIKNKKKIYILPTIELISVRLEGDMAVQSPVRTVNVEKWDTSDDPSQPENNTDIILPF